MYSSNPNQVAQVHEELAQVRRANSDLQEEVLFYKACLVHNVRRCNDGDAVVGILVDEVWLLGKVDGWDG
jgi:hypothetical protein